MNVNNKFAVYSKDMPRKIDDLRLRTPRKVRFDLPTVFANNKRDDNDDDDNDDDDNDKHGTLNLKSTHKLSNSFDRHPAKMGITTKRPEKKVHGTGNYVNGTLNFSTADYSMMMPVATRQTIQRQPDIERRPILLRNEFTNDASAKNVRKNCSIDQQYWDNAVNRRGILLHVSSENQQASNIKFRTNKFRRYTSALMGSSKYFKRSRNRLLNCSTTSPSFSNTLELPKLNQSNKKQKPHLKSSKNPFEKFSYKLVNIKSAARKRAQVKPCETQSSDEFDERALTIVCNAFNNQTELGHQCASENLSEILQLAHRWQADTTHSMLASDNESTARESSNSVESCTLKKIDVKM